MASPAAQYALGLHPTTPLVQPDLITNVCSLCELMAIDEEVTEKLFSEKGYEHSSTDQMQAQAYAGCPFCLFLFLDIQSKIFEHGGVQTQGGTVVLRVMQSKKDEENLHSRRIVMGIKYEVVPPSGHNQISQPLISNEFLSLDPEFLKAIQREPDHAVFHNRYEVMAVDVDSKQVSNCALELFGDCLNNHAECPKAEVTLLPQRLLEIGLENELERVRLHICSEGERGVYIALSYCWGTQTVIATKDTLDKMCEEIDCTALPKTIQDAIKTTRRLGIRYLWVDALCIIQDDLEGKVAEIEKMDQIYGNATITLAAGSARTSADGFLWPRITSRTFQLPMLNITINLPFRALEFKYLPSHEPLDTRGWTLQESLLSPRLIVYGLKDIYWKCKAGAIGMLSGQKYPDGSRMSFQNLRPPTNSTEDKKKSQISIWDNIITNFTARQLTFSDDSLPAIAGVAKVLARAWDDEYIAGMWKESLITLLAWSVDPKTTRPRQLDRCGPTWSWCSLYSPVIFDVVAQEMAILVSCNVQLKHDYASFGQVDGGVLVLRAEVVQASSLSRNYPESQITLDDGTTPSVKENDNSLQGVHYLFLGNHPSRGGRGLVLKQQPQGWFTRIGRIRIRPGWNSWKAAESVRTATVEIH